VVVQIGETDWGLDVAKPPVREALEDTDEPLEDLFHRMGHRRSLAEAPRRHIVAGQWIWSVAGEIVDAVLSAGTGNV
jgi:hypothetical protein